MNLLEIYLILQGIKGEHHEPGLKNEQEVRVGRPPENEGTVTSSEYPV